MKKVYFILICLVVSGSLFAQKAGRPPFWQDIQEFKKQDSAHFPAPRQILFVGSSSFTLWKDVEEYFPGYKLINRGFGGSTLPDVLNYADDVIMPYRARQIVIYCGENDLASSDTVTVEMVVNRFKKLFDRIRSGDKKVFVSYVSMKPSPSRKHLLPKFVAANREIEAFLKNKKRTSFINVYDRMLGEGGTLREELYLEDKLHMNAKGYAIWQKEIEPHLRK